MKVRILNQQDSEITKDLFKTPNFMGANINEKDFFVAEKHVEFYHESF